MMIVAFNVVTMENALIKVQAVYEYPWQAAQMGIAGFFFIISGLIFTKMLVKSIRPSDDVILYGKWGYVNISIRAIENLVKKTLRKHDFVQAIKIKTDAEGNELKIKANLNVFSSPGLTEHVQNMQQGISARLSKMLGDEIELQVNVNVVKIIEKKN